MIRPEQGLTAATRLLVAATIATVAIVLVPIATASRGPAGAGIALANANCGTKLANLFDGWEADKQGGYGSEASTVAQSAPLCSNGSYPPGAFGNASSAWAMLLANDANMYAQAGFIWEELDSQALYFVEWEDSSCPYQSLTGSLYSYCMRTWGSVANGHNDEYQVFPASNGKMNMEIDGSIVGQSSYVANCTNDWCGPWGQEWNGETTGPGNNVPGSSSSRTNFTTVDY